MATLTSLWVNAHLSDEAEPTTPLDFMSGLSPTEQTAEVKAIFEQLAIDQTMDRLKSEEAYRQGPAVSR